MDMKECVRTRRSVRSFTQQPVSQEMLRHVVELASFAPSWKNSQTARYIAVFDEQKKHRLAAECTTFAQNAHIMEAAALVVALVTVDNRSGYERDGSFSTSKGTHWQSFDAGIAAQTFCLAAHEAGLGSVIMGLFDEEKAAEVLALPKGMSVSALIAIGYPAEEPKAPARKTVDDLLHIL